MPAMFSRLLLIFPLIIGLFLCCSGSFAQEEEEYPIPPEAERQEGVPEGKVDGPFTIESKIYSGTQREYWVYVPHQYDAEKPACTMIVQDGLNRAKDWRLPQICDNLIHANEMPVTIGIFVNPGVLPPERAGAQPRFNRSFEYDSLGDNYARFLLEELIPEVSKSYNLSTSPGDRVLAGASSGGICAFNAAWERPDAFRRVISTIGTFVGLRGANELPVLVRKVEPKPLRVFLQDGSNDLNIYAGDWWVANQDLLSSLQWAGYDVKQVWGTGGHNGKHGAAVMPEALRWIWRDYPEPIQVTPSPAAKRRTDIMLADSDWQQISSGHQAAEAPVCNAAGELFFADSKAGRIYRIGEDGKTRIFKEQSGRVSSLGFGPQGNLFAVRDAKQVVRFEPDGKETIILNDIQCQRILTLPEGFYFSDNSTPALHWSTYEGQITMAHTLPEPVAAFTTSADHGFLHAAPVARQFTYHLQIAADRTLKHRQRYGHLHMPYLDATSGVTSMSVDNQGSLFVASNMGIQVLDQLGRVHLILKKPSKPTITGIAFGGAMHDTLFATAGENVYARKLKTRGMASYETAVELPKPGL
ncbi:MAG: alpha/beta hydrolase-fold protein [Pirellulaceae bacterium]